MAIPPRSEEWSDEIDPKEAGNFWSDAWHGVTDTVSTVGKGIGDVATGNFSQLGKDVSKGVKNFEKDYSQIGKDVKRDMSSAWNVVKHYGPEILTGAAMIGLGVATGGIGFAAEGALVGAADLAGTVAVDAAADTAATAVTDTAVSATEDVAGSALKTVGKDAVDSVAKDTTKSVLKDTTKSIAEDTADSTAKPSGLVDSAGRSIPSTLADDTAADTATDSAASGIRSKIQNALQTVKDNPTFQKAKSFATNPLTVGVGMAAEQQANSSDGSSQPTTPATPPPTITPQTFAPVNINPTSQAEGAAIQGNVYTGSANSNDKILDLINQFGLHPEDIKSSLTSWA